MRRVPSHALLGPAVLLYLLADAAAAQGQLDPRGVIVAALAGLLALTPLLCARQEGRGAAQVGGLGVLAAFVLLRRVAPEALSLGVELAEVLATSGAAWLLFELAARVPDAVPRATALVRAGRVVALGSALVGLAAVLPVEVGWVASPALARVPGFVLGASVLAAIGLRLSRRRLGSDPEALAANAWASVALAPAALVVASTPLLGLLGLQWNAEHLRVVTASCAVWLVLGHLRMVEPERDARTGPALRALAATTLSLATTAAFALVVWPRLPDTLLARAALAASVALLALVSQRGFSELTASWLAPGRGRLLRALERGQASLLRCRDLDELAAVVLGAAREASGDPSAEPWLMLFTPPLEYRIDAAGQPRVTATPPHPELLAAVQARPGELLLRAPLQAQHVRAPALRGVVDALVERDALCALPLVAHGELEGLLVIPRGVRGGHVALEELHALRRFGAQLGGLLSVVTSEARARRRADEVFAQKQAQERELSEARADQGRLRLEVDAARHGDNARAEAAVVAYGPAMRALLAQLGRAGKDGLSVLLWAERGVDVEPLARIVHARSPRADGPCVVVDCSALRPEAMAAALVGSGAADAEPGLLARAAGGTLVLSELPALSSDAQQVLSAALATRRAHLVATSRKPLDELCERGVLRAELRDGFGLHARVPPLRERKEDVPSLLLFALDRAARVLGRPAVGIDDEALAVLLDYDFPGNEQELEALIERAVELCDGPRVGLPQLVKLLPAKPGANPLDATLETVERRALRRALDRAGGSKSEAARLLGVPRTTLIDKLRRHGIEPAAGARERASERPGSA